MPGAGPFSHRWLQATNQSAAARAGTVADGQDQEINATRPHLDHRGWSTHTVALRDKTAKPNQAPSGIFVTSGEIGTNAMHPPGKRSIGINKFQNHEAIPNRYARADTAVRPYAEDLFQ